MHGRAAEWRVVGELLRRAEQGAGGVILVDGERGTGKSLLLRETEGAAVARGFSLAAAAADQLAQTLPFFALRTALRQPFVTQKEGRQDSIAWQIGELQERLTELAASAPVLVSLDELQWAGQATLLALRVLPAQLARFPVAWLLARSDERHDHGVDVLFNALENDGARRLTLGPLGDAAVTAALTEAFGAPPDERLLDLAAEAGGNPSLLTELIGGLRDDNAVRLIAGRACLGRADLPSRIHHVARQRLDGLTRRAQYLLKTAAVLGGAFRLADMAEMLGDTSAALLPAIEEALAAGMIVADDAAFSFRHRLLCRATATMVPRPARSALHRQFGELLVRRGESAAAAAGHLLEAASTGDLTSVTGLDSAAEELLPSAPRTAAALAVRALELTPPDDPGMLARSVAAAETLTAAGRLDHASQIAGDALVHPLIPEAEARLRCVLSSVLCADGQPGPARAEAQAALAQPHLPPGLRSQALTAHLQALAGLGQDQTAERVAAGILSAPDDHNRPAIAAAMVTRAMLCWDRGHTSEALGLLRDAARHNGAVSADARHVQPLLAEAAALADLGQEGQAGKIIEAIDSQSLKGIPAQAALLILTARLSLARGCPGQAARQAEAALSAAGSASSYAWLARCLQSFIALRQGDVEAACHHLAGYRGPVPRPAALYARSAAAMTAARVTEAREGPAAAIPQLRNLCADLPERPGSLLGEPASLAWLVRTALAADELDLAETVTHAASGLARKNPEIPAFAAAAAHSRGLLSQDPGQLAQAAAEHPDSWARASAAEDLGTLLTSRTGKDEAIAQLTRALDGYREAGAANDMARVRGRLRALGVRRRHWTPAPGRPVTGWESLTEAEHATAELVAQGLNNKQIGSRLYISRHTVAFHLRQIFLKLHIGSRVELARIVIENSA
jgi:DNA-binding CsgD family transcriptional regulator